MATEIIVVKNLTAGVSLENVVAGKLATLFSDGGDRDVIVKHSVKTAAGSHHSLNIPQVKKIAQSVAKKDYCGWGFKQIAAAEITEA
jgi:hypothetical protein